MTHIKTNVKQFSLTRSSLIAGLGTGLLVGLSLILSNAKVLAATSAATPMNIYYGTTHMHTGAQNDHGGDSSNADDVFNAAKANGFDFLFLTEHSGPSGPYSPTKYYTDAQKFALDASKEGSSTATGFNGYRSAANVDGNFIGFAGYEYSENGGDGDSDSGHMTGYGTDAFISASQKGMKFSTFMDAVSNQNQSRVAFAGFNHPPAAGHGGSVASNLTPARREVVAMSEAQRNVSYKTTDEVAYYKGTVAALDRGWRVAPTCGLDGHGLFAVKQKESSSKKPCRTGVLAPSLTRTDLLNAFQERRIYSSRDTNMRVKYSVNG